MKYISYIIIFAYLGMVAPHSFASQVNFDPDASVVPGEILVKFKSGTFDSQTMTIDGIAETSQVSINAIFSQLQVSKMRPVFRSTESSLKDIQHLHFGANIPLIDALEQIAEDPNVEWAQPNYIRRISVTPNDPSLPIQWGITKVQAKLAWDISQGDANTIIAVIDTGVDYDHLDLANNIWHNPGEIPENGIDDDGNGYIDDHIGWDFVSRTSGGASGEDMAPSDNDPMDFQGHGTHCSGIASAVTNNKTGVAGMGWSCQIMALRAGYKTTTGGGSLADSDTSEALRYAADNNAHIISMSWGDSGSSPTLNAAINYAYNAGCILVAAAGNDDSDADHYPASYANVIAVGASDENDNQATSTTWGSNYGSWVDIAAPGKSIYNTSYNSAVGNSTYVYMSGTSMATPLVAGVVGLILSLQPGLSPEDVRDRLVDTGDDINWGSGFVGPTKRVNAYQALIAAGPPDVPTDLVATPISISQINLEWDNVEAESGYEIQRKEAGGIYQQIDTTGTDITEYSDAELDEGTTYTYQVQAYNGAGSSGWSNGDSATTLINQPPAVSSIPDIDFDEDGADNSIDLDDYVNDPDNSDDDMDWTYAGNTNIIVDINPSASHIVTFTSPANWNGSEDITFTATDPHGKSDDDTITVTVNPVNDPPVVAEIPNVGFNEDGSNNSIDLDDYVSDLDNSDSEIDWTYTGNTDVTIAIDENNIVTFSASANWHGNENISFTATDPGDQSDSDIVTVTVISVNDPPMVAGVPDVEFDEDGSDNSIDLDNYVTDPDNDASEMNWTYTGDTDVIVSIDENNIVTFSTPANWDGSENITFTATDPGGQDDSDTITVTVNPINDPPVVSKIPDIDFDEDKSNSGVDLDLFVTDSDNSKDNLDWTYTGDTNINVSIDENNGVTFSAPANWNGSEDITFTATDPGGQNDNDTITVTVNPVNDPPVATGIPNVEFDEDGTNNSIDLDDYVADLDNLDSEIDWTYTGNTNVTVSIDANNIVTFGASTNWNGSENIAFTATDPEGKNDADTTAVTVNPVNDPPVVTGVPDVDLDEDESDNSVDLDDYVTDPDNTSSEMDWVYSGNTNITVAIDINSVVTLGALANWSGSENITFTATDPEGQSNNDIITVTVNPTNDPPVVAGIPDIKFNEDGSDNSIDLDDYVSDPDNTDVDMTWTYTGNTNVSVVISDNHGVSLTALENWSGIEIITFKATDPGGQSGDDIISVIVGAVSDSPVVGGLPDVEFNEDSPGSSLDLDDYVTDPDDSDSDIVWAYAGNTNISIDINSEASHIATFSAPENWNGSEEITLTATDPGGLNNSDTMTVTVNPVNDPPTASDLGITPISPNSGDDLHALYTYSDMENDPEANTSVRWYRNGEYEPIYDNTLDIPASATLLDDEWYFEVTPDDGADTGLTEISAPVLVGGVIQQIELYPGWNFVSIYVDLINADLLSVLQSIDGIYKSVWTYDKSSEEWKRYIPDGPDFLNNLKEMRPGNGYWIEVDGNDVVVLIISGQAIANFPIDLYDGWNMTGFNSATPQSREAALASIIDRLISIWTYNIATNTWLKYIPGAPDFLNTLEQLEPGSAYWIEVDGNCVWSISP